MKQRFFLYVLMALVTSSLCAKEMKVQVREFPQKELKKQNIQIATMAAQAMSKNLPQKIDQYTTLRSVKNDNSTLIYTFVISSNTKSDKEIIREDHSRMQKAITKGVCQSSQRFLKAGINTSYIYVSKKTGTPLFRFDITQAKCTNLTKK
ncbi:hypothetical protein [Sulfurimonas sp.]|uniref:hypothetical protein n=1 Tax=Sulfurimonas sp. TaxID=2022749 RepID=UPI002624E913|nr:hypothetical protein [Sulfurimonas sp.]